MKIGICGSFSVWKTTLLNLIKEEYGNFNFILSTERELAKKLNFDFNNSSINEKITFQQKLIHEQINLESNSKNIITDTSIIDIYAYSHFIKDKDFSIFNDINNKIKSHKYDILFYIPIENEIEKDWVRHVDNNFRSHIDNLIKENLSNFWKKIIHLKWNPKERFEIFNKNIKIKNTKINKI